MLQLLHASVAYFYYYNKRANFIKTLKNSNLKNPSIFIRI
ncbi:hypothetical protein J559_0305 [Acinetobacter sp. 983759]|nr:hypothetical protein J559_0305 [Acinetobacter sp. 983759]